MARRRLAAGVILFLIITVFSGCGSMSAEDLYKLPKMPGDYYMLYERIEEVTASGGQLVQPASGFNRQPLQMVDMDSDGRQEAVACFRFASDKPMKIYIFKNDGNRFSQAAVIEEDCQGIDSIYYDDLTGNGTHEIIVGWQAEQGALRALSVYRATEENYVEIGGSEYSEYNITDIDADGINDIIITQYDAAAMTGTVKQLSYSEQEHMLETVSEAPMSKNIESLSRVILSRLTGGERAVYVAGVYGSSGIITDIFAFRDGKLENITLDKEKEISEKTVRQSAIYAADIVGQGYLSLPQLVKLPKYNNNENADDFWKIEWFSFSLDGSARLAATTYHNFTSGWYILLPDELKENLTMRRETDTRGDRTTYFARHIASDGKSIDLLKIKTVSSANIDEVKRNGVGDNQILLYDGADMLVIAEPVFPQDYNGYVFTREEIINRFFIVQKEWLTAE